MIEFRIDRRTGLPAYQQIIDQVKQALRLGLLRVDDQLPTAREVVEATAINPNTVLKAYRALEQEGLAEGRRGSGTFIVGTVATTLDGPDSPIGTELDRWMKDAAAQRLSVDDVEALFGSIRDRHYPRGSS